MKPEGVRDRLLAGLSADLIGPFAVGTPGIDRAEAWRSDEVLTLPPSRWYLTGFLAPQGGRAPRRTTSSRTAARRARAERATRRTRARTSPSPRGRRIARADVAAVQPLLPQGEPGAAGRTERRRAAPPPTTEASLEGFAFLNDAVEVRTRRR
jgi:hypothetical protein